MKIKKVYSKRKKDLFDNDKGLSLFEKKLQYRRTYIIRIDEKKIVFFF